MGISGKRSGDERADGVGPALSRDAVWRGQVLLLVGAWAAACLLFHANDGLWFQGDAPRHALNGLFYRDLLQHGWSDPRGYTEQYYVRYPAICPTYYPPVFYLLEAIGYAIVGPQWWVGKAVSMASGLLAGGYMLAWLRRWVGESSGWLAGLLVWTPGIAEWMNAAMLNVPATALGFGALYHLRRALESDDPQEEGRQVMRGIALAGCGILTHPIVAVVLGIGLAWIFALRRWQIFRNRRVWLAAGVAALAIVPVVYVLYRFGDRLEQVAPSDKKWSPLNRQSYYPLALVRLCTWTTSVTALLGLVAGLWNSRYRRDVVLLLLWLLVFYGTFQLTWAKSGRYALLLCPAVVILVAIFLRETADQAQRVLSVKHARWLAAVLAASIALGMLSVPIRKPSPNVSLMHEVAAYLQEKAPREPVFYRGRHDGVFTLYLRLGDPGMERQVVSLVSWMRDQMGDQPIQWGSDEGPQVAQQAMFASGIRWFVTERLPTVEGASTSASTPGTSSALPPSQKRLVDHPGFRLVRTFEGHEPPYLLLDVYHLSGEEGVEPRQSPERQSPQEVPRRISGRWVSPVSP